MATVDRVLNERGRVRESTAKRIREIAEELGFESSVYRKALKFRILLQDPEHLYYQELGRHIKAEAEAIRRLGVSVELSFLADTSNTAIAKKIDEMAQDADGIAGVFIQHTFVQEAISRILDSGRPVVTLLTDIRHPLRTCYVGLDNRMVGRTAGYVMGRLTQSRAGRVVVTTETLNYVGLEEREMGFRSIIKEKFPHLEMLSVIERGEVREVSRQRTIELLRDESVIGVFNAGGRNREVHSAIKRAGREPRDLVFIGSELTDYSRHLLINEEMDMVISLPAAVAARETIQALLVAAGRAQAEPSPAFQPFQIYFSENVL